MSNTELPRTSSQPRDLSHATRSSSGSDPAPMGLFGAVVRPLQAFLRLEAASGILLLLCAVVALVWANLHPQSYRAVFDYPLTIGAGAAVATFTVGALISDG